MDISIIDGQKLKIGADYGGNRLVLWLFENILCHIKDQITTSIFGLEKGAANCYIECFETVICQDAHDNLLEHPVRYYRDCRKMFKQVVAVEVVESEIQKTCNYS